VTIYLYCHKALNKFAVDVDEEDAFGLTPLHWASFYGQITTVQLLLQKGAIVDKEGKEGETALQLAAAGGHHDTLKILLSEGADLNHIDEVSIDIIGQRWGFFQFLNSFIMCVAAEVL
jgi:ankyrin repeat protein